MLKQMTRTRLIQVWFAAVLLVAVAGLALGMSITVGTGALLIALSVVPPVIVLLLWPAGLAPTAADVLRGAERRD